MIPMVHYPRSHFTAFMGHRRLAAGPPAEVALAVMNASRKPAAAPIIIFDDTTGRPLDLDLRGSEREIIARLPQPASPPDEPTDAPPAEPRARGPRETLPIISCP